MAGQHGDRWPKPLGSSERLGRAVRKGGTKFGKSLAEQLGEVWLPFGRGAILGLTPLPSIMPSIGLSGLLCGRGPGQNNAPLPKTSTISPKTMAHLSQNNGTPLPNRCYFLPGRRFCGKPTSSDEKPAEYRREADEKPVECRRKADEKPAYSRRDAENKPRVIPQKDQGAIRPRKVIRQQVIPQKDQGAIRPRKVIRLQVIPQRDQGAIRPRRGRRRGGD